MDRVADLTQLFARFSGEMHLERGVWFVRDRAGSLAQDVTSFSALERAALRVAGALQQLGLARGARVALAISAPEHALPFLLGAMHAGLVPVTIAPPVSTRELASFAASVAHALRDTSASALITASKLRPHLAPARAEIDAIATTLETETLLDARAAFTPVSITPSDTALITWDGERAHARSHAQWLDLLEDARQALGVEEDSDVFASWLAPFDELGLRAWLLALYAGCSLALLPEVQFLKRPLAWLAMISQTRATISFAPAVAYERCLPNLSDALALDLSAWRIAGSTHGSIPRAVQTGFAEKLTRSRLRATVFDAAANLHSFADAREGELSHGQRALWFLAQLAPDSVAYNVPLCWHISSEYDAGALHRALACSIERHAALRTVFPARDGMPYRKVLAELPAWFEDIDASGFDEPTLRERLDRELARKFDLEHGPLFLARLFRRGPRDAVLLLIAHHLCVDALSFIALGAELAALYPALARGQTPPALPPLAATYDDFVAWQAESLAGSEGERLRRYWSEQLAGVAARVDLPSDRPRPDTQTYAGAVLRCELPGALVNALRTLAEVEGTTLYTAVLSAFQAFVSRTSGQRELVVGTPVAGRSRSVFQGTIGCFVNTLPIRAALSDGLTFRALVQQQKQTVLEALDHQDLPFSSMVELAGLPRDTSRLPLCQVMFQLQSHQTDTGLRAAVGALPGAGAVELGGLACEPVALEPDVAQCDVRLDLREHGGTVAGFWEYNTDLFDRATISAWHEQLLQLTAAWCEEPDAPLAPEAKAPSPIELQRQLVLWNDTRVDFPAGTVQRAFERQAAAAPAAIALEFGADSLSYGELNRRANRLAARLRERGVTRDVVVGVCMERSIELVIALLGTLKAGGAYLPLDPTYPRARLEHILSDASPALVITDDELAPTLPELEACLRTSELRAIGADASIAAVDPEHESAPEDLVYVIFTSGSTGMPKGVGNTHAGLWNRLCWMQAEYRLTDADCVLHKTPYSFDVSVWEFFWPLMAGARLAMAKPGGHRDSRYLLEAIQRHRVTTLHFVPSMLQAFMDEDVSNAASLRRVICSGEALPYALVRRFLAALPRVELHNLYGPTEASIDVTAWRCREHPRQIVPIGRPIANTQIYLLDERLAPVPIGAIGELYIGGIGLARGYHRRPELTAERFIANPIAGAPSARLYKTGDLARYDSDGTIEYVGRNDDQIKLRGFRIELGEIEAVLSEHPNVKQGVVALRWLPAGARLEAFVVLHDHATFDAGALRSWLGERLAEHMLPQRLQPLAAIPLTHSGKADRKALLAAPAMPSPARDGAPRTELEQTLFEVWREVLGLTQLSIHDNFFELGGDSIRTLQLRARARQRGVSFELQTLFAQQTIAELAATLEAGAPVAPERVLAPFELLGLAERGALRDYEDAYPATQLQLGMLYHSQLTAAAWTYHDSISLELEFDRSFSEQALQDALTAVMARHAILRAAFDVGSFRRPLVLITRHAPAPLTVHDLRASSPDAARARMRAYAEADRTRGYRLDRAPLFRLHAQQLTDARVRLTLSFHHAILDGWSAAIFQRELLVEYLRRTWAIRLPAPEAPKHGYSAFVALEEQASASVDSRTFFRELWGDGELVRLPRWPAAQRSTTQEQGARRLIVALEPELSARIAARATELRASKKTLLLAAHVRALAALTGSDRVSTGCVTHGRPELSDADRMLGLFLNTLPVCMSLGADTWAELVHRLARYEAELFAHRRLPLREIQRALGQDALFETAFNYVNFHLYADLAASAALRVHETEIQENTGFAILANFVEHPGTHGLALHLEYDPARVTAEHAQQIADAHRLALEALSAELHVPARASRVITTAEEVLLARWQDGGSPAAISCLQQPFEASVERTPNAIAASIAGARLTYAELEAWSNRIAAQLCRAGCARGDVVAVCAEPGLARVAAVLGVLKASCAYLPIDPSFPPERLAYMIEHAGVQRGLVTPAHVAAECLARIGRIVVSEPDTRPCARPERAAEPGDPAYVIYTSGSTGRPKGIVMPHAPLASLMAWQCAHSAVGTGDATAHVSAFSFDVSCQELFSTWSSGGELVIVPESARRDVRALLQLLRERSVARLFVPVVLLHELAEISAQLELDLPALREVITAGEQLEITPVVRAFFRRHPGCRLENQYGPSETHVVTAQPLAAEPELWRAAPAIGRPLPGARAYVVDGQRQPAPIGVPGELILAGNCVATGYIADPELTAERFGADPFVPDARSYATGDVARWLPDGTLEYLGRRDAQVKIRGYRVELAEVEAAIVAAAGGGVRRAAVIVQPGGRQLAAYVQCAPGARLDASALERALARRLPGPMLPSIITPLESWPLTPSGKLDRRALPAIADSGAGREREHIAPETPLEIELCGLWQDVLELSAVGVTDDFFAIGGDSLRAVRLMARVQRRYGLELPIAALIEAPNVRQLARALEAAPSAPSAPRAAIKLHAGRAGDAPLFCVHPVGGNVLCYMPLARRLGSTCYALQARGLDGRARPHSSVVEMASAYAAEIAHKQPSGRVHLAGWSFGGVVALEIARQLRHAGRELGPLVVLDSIASVKWQIEPSDDALLECVAMELLGTQVDDALFEALFVEPGDRAAKLQKLLAAAQARGLDADRGATGQLEHVFAIIQNNIRAAFDYRPGSYAGEVVLLRCQDPMPQRLLRMHDMIGSVYDAPDNGWGALCADLRIVPVRGDHLSLVFEPYVEQVADVVRSILPRRDDARASVPVSI